MYDRKLIDRDGVDKYTTEIYAEDVQQSETYRDVNDDVLFYIEDVQECHGARPPPHPAPRTPHPAPFDDLNSQFLTEEVTDLMQKTAPRPSIEGVEGARRIGYVIGIIWFVGCVAYGFGVDPPNSVPPASEYLSPR